MILLQSTRISKTEFSTVLESNREYQSFASYWLERSDETSIRSELKNAFAHAQQVFLQSEISAMKPDWERVYAFAYKSDWPEIYGEMIQIAGMRLAQLSSSTIETEKWLRLVIEFNSRYEPPKELFPPPLIEQYRRIRLRLGTILFHPPPEFGFDKILINGLPYEIANAAPISLPDAMVRITYLSSKYAPISRVINAREIKNLKPTMQTLVSGSCENPELNLALGFDLNINDVGLVYSQNCVTPVKRAVTVGGASSLSRTNNLADPINAIEVSSSVETHTAFYRKPWFWVGATAVIGAVVFSLQPRGETSPPPSHTEGF